MQSPNYRTLKRYHFFDAAGMFMAAVLFFLAFYQYWYRDSIMLKLGMSHFFSPAFVGFLTYFMMVFNLLSAVYLVFKKSPLAIILSLIVFTSYSVYSVVLMITTKSYCGCANIFRDLDQRDQLGTGV